MNRRDRPRLIVCATPRPRMRQAMYDAVHLASALAFGAATTLVTWDDDLARAALASGCGVAPSV